MEKLRDKRFLFWYIYVRFFRKLIHKSGEMAENCVTSCVVYAHGEINIDDLALEAVLWQAGSVIAKHCLPSRLSLVRSVFPNEPQHPSRVAVDE